MATLLDLERAGAVSRIDPELNPRIQELRLIYTSPGVQQWIEQVLPTLESTWKVEENPIEQLTALIEIFCAGVVADVNTTCPHPPAFRPLADLPAFRRGKCRERAAQQRREHRETVAWQRRHPIIERPPQYVVV